MNETEFEKHDAEIQLRLNDPMTSVKDLAEAIEKSRELTERVMARANSALYGSRRKVTSLMQAIVLIGFRNVRILVNEMKAESQRPPTPPEEREAEM